MAAIWMNGSLRRCRFSGVMIKILQTHQNSPQFKKDPSWTMEAHITAKLICKCARESKQI
jgi:hypothetical protein